MATNGNTDNHAITAEQKRISDLECQLKMALAEIKILKNKISSDKTERKSYSPPNADEEEEIVNRKTTWLLPKYKKRKASHSPEQSKVSPIKHKTTEPKVHKPPPVIISNLINYTEITQNLQLKNLDFNATMMNNNQLKINVNIETEYRELTQFMNSIKQEWHTYEDKQVRPIRVMVRNAHPSCDPTDITTELTEKDFKVISVENKLKKTKNQDKTVYTKLPLFTITFDNKEDIKFFLWYSISV